MGSLSPTHWLIIAGLIVVLFGAKRLPDAARSMGRSLRIFKSEVHELGEDGNAAPPDDRGQRAIDPAGPPRPEADRKTASDPVTTAESRS